MQLELLRSRNQFLNPCCYFLPKCYSYSQIAQSRTTSAVQHDASSRPHCRVFHGSVLAKVSNVLLVTDCITVYAVQDATGIEWPGPTSNLDGAR